jgi:hypothetical protein
MSSEIGRNLSVVLCPICMSDDIVIDYNADITCCIDSIDTEELFLYSGTVVNTDNMHFYRITCNDCCAEWENECDFIEGIKDSFESNEDYRNRVKEFIIIG